MMMESQANQADLKTQNFNSAWDSELNQLATLLNYTERGTWAFALTNTVTIRDALVAELKSRLTLPCYEFTFTATERNPLDYLARLPPTGQQQRAIIFFYDIERAFPDVLGYLDLNREWFLQRPHALVFWITNYARRELALKAPNFWSRRHSVFDFTLPQRELLLSLRGEMAGGDVQYEDLEDWTRKLRLYQGLLDEYLAEAEQDRRTIADLYGKVADLHYRRGNYSEAAKNLNRELDIRQQLDDQLGVAANNNNIGAIYQARGDYDQALHYYQQSVAIEERLGNQAGLATSYNNIGEVHRARGNYEQALHYYRQSVAIGEKLDGQAELAASYNNIGMIYQAWGDYDQALHYYQQSVAIGEKLGDQAGLATNYNNIGAIYKARGEYEQALHYYQQSAAIGEKLGGQAGLAANYNNIAFVYQARGDITQAVAYFEKSLAILEGIRAQANAAVVRKNLTAARGF